MVIPPVYQYLGRSGQNSDLILAKKNDFWGALNGDGEVIVPFVWDDIWLDVAYGCLAKKNTRHGPRYAIMGEDGTVLIGDLPSIPHHLDGYYDRIVKNGDTVCVLHCRLRYVHGEDQIRMGHKWYSSCEEAKEEMNGVLTADEEENDAENSL